MIVSPPRLRACTIAISLGLLALVQACRPSAQYQALPYHNTALVHQSRPPYQRPTAATMAAGHSTPASKAPKHDAPSRPRTSHAVKAGSHTGGTESTIITTQIDTQKRRVRPADGYEPRYAVAYIIAIYAINGIQFTQADQLTIPELYRAIQRQGTIYHAKEPVIGDLVFFHNTFDANGDGRNNDWYTHVGIVTAVDKDGTISFLSYRNRTVVRGYMNLTQPRSQSLDGKTINTRLRAPHKQDPPYTQYLSGELYAGFGSVLGDSQQVAIMRHWQPKKR